MDQLINIDRGQAIYVSGREQKFCRFVPSESEEISAPDDLQFEDTRNGRIHIYTRDEFDALYETGQLRWKKSPALDKTETPEEHGDDGVLRSVRQAFTKAFDESPVSKTEGPLTQLYADVLKKLGLPQQEWARSSGTLRRWVNKLGEPGKRPRSCMGNRHRRGSRGMTLEPIVLDVLESKAERYWDNLRVTATDVFVETRSALTVINKERKTGGLPPVRVPGRTTVWRYLTSHCNFDKTRRRFGARTAERTFKPLKGSLEAKHILDVAIMDHTWADCHVVDDVNNVPVGRPYITLMIDVRSRYPLSFVIGYTPPGVETAMACIRRAVRPKKWIRDQFPDIQGEWVGYGVPRTVLVDNGWEFSGGSFKDACEDAGISVEWAPVRTPEYKGICERFFRTLNQLVIHKLQGSVPLTPQKLKELGIDPSAEAVVLLSELEELICQAIIEVYGRDFHQGIKAIPEQVWKTDQALVGIDYAADLQALDLSLGKMGPQRKLTKNGIQFLGLTYRSEAVFGLLDTMLPRQRKRGMPRDGVKVKFKYWPEDLSKIAVWNGTNREYVELPCTDTAYSKNLAEHHHQILSKYAVEVGLKFSTEDQRCAARTRLNAKIGAFVSSRKIGDRRRAQRLLADKRYDAGVAMQNTPVHDHINLIEAISNRTGGDNPARNPVRIQRKRASPPPNSTKLEGGIGSDGQPKTARHVPNPFSSFDPQDYL